jgi:hypothetical protein
VRWHHARDDALNFLQLRRKQGLAGLHALVLLGITGCELFEPRKRQRLIAQAFVVAE